MEASDPRLVDRWLKERDAYAFRELVARYAGLVHATSRRILRDPASADDVTQECFLKLCETGSPPRCVPGWLHRLATRASLDRLRSRRRRREVERRGARDTGPAGPTSDPVEAAAWAETERLVDEAIDALPEELRAPIVRHYLGGEKLGAIASELAVSRNTVTSRLKRGVEAIRAHLRRRGVTVASTLLSGWLSARMVEAAPAGVVSQLARLALAGERVRLPDRPSSAGATGWASGGSMKILISIAAAVAAIACIWAIVPRHEGPSEGGPGSPTPTVTAQVPPPLESPQETSPPPREPPPETVAPDTTTETEARAVLAGTIRTEEGEPVADAEVCLVVHPPEGDRDLLGSGRLGEGYFRRSHSRVAITGDDGCYRMEGIPWSGPSTVGVFAAGLAGAQQHVELEAETRREDLDFTMPPGRTLLGRVVTGAGEPVADALVSVSYAWHSKDMAWGASLSPTAGDGRFALGFSARAERCSLRVNSDSLGQDFFLNLEIPEAKEEVELRLHDTATIRGTITWAGGAPAAGVFVAVRAEVPEPDIPVWYSGMRPAIFVEEAVGADGQYEIEGLYPGLSYDVYVLPEGEDRLAAHRSSLSPQWKSRFTPGPGEVKTWDYAVPLPIVVRGRVITDITATPVPRMEVGVLKDGTAIHELTARCDEEGRFELSINTGPGEYRVHARPSHGHEGPARVIAERYGQTLVLRGGDAVDVELRVFEPIVLPIRVLDCEGAPVESIRTQLDFQTPDEKRYGVGDSRSLQDDGRSRVLLHFPVKQLSLEVGRFPSGPMTEKQVFEAAPGTVLPEATFRLPRVCDVTAVLVGPDGAPHAKRRVTLDVEYAGGTRERASVQTDEDGFCSVEGQVRAAVLDLTIRVDGVEGTWRATGLDATGGHLDLGPVRVPTPQR